MDEESLTQALVANDAPLDLKVENVENFNGRENMEMLDEKLLRNFSSKNQIYKISEPLSRHKKDPRIWTLASEIGARNTTRDAETFMQIIETIKIGDNFFTKVKFYPKTTACTLFSKEVLLPKAKPK